MKYEKSYDAARARREYVRQLGFDPDQLTSEEQRELLELEARLRVSEGRQRDLATR